MSSPEQIRAEIERTRQNLSNDVNALEEKVSPSHIASRQVGRVKAAVGSTRDKVMGATSGAASSAHDSAAHAGSIVGSTVGDLGSAVQAAPDKLRSGAAGNPLAAGMITFGLGWLIGSLLPTTAREQELAVKAKDTALPEITDAAKEVAENLKGPAQDAASAVKNSATDAAAVVKDEGLSAKDDLTDQAQDAKQAVQNS